jgi:hypothetical protein
MAYGVDTSVKGMKAARPHAAVDLILGEAERVQLRSGNDPVLSFSESGDSSSLRFRHGWVWHTATKACRTGGSPPS